MTVRLGAPDHTCVFRSRPAAFALREFAAL